MAFSQHRFFLFVCLLLIAGLLLFGWTVWERSAHFGTTPIGISGWNTAGTALVASHWYREGPLSLGFGMYWTPASIETAPAERELYASYPPGAIVPIYTLALLSGNRPTPALVMGWNLLLQCLTAFFLAATVSMIALQGGVPRTAAILFGMPSFLLYLLLPSPYYEHLMGYFADQAITAPFAAFVLIEALRWPYRAESVPRTLSLVHGLLALYGCLSDWLFFFLVFCVLLLRLVSGGLGHTSVEVLRRALLFLLPAGLAVVLFLVQLLYLGGLDQLYDRLMFRSGLDDAPSVLTLSTIESEEGTLLDSFFWQRHIPNGYGQAGKTLILLVSGALPLLLLAALLIRFRKRTAPPLFARAVGLLFLLVVPPWLYLIAFPTHNNMILHFFTALKFAPLLAAGAWGALPLAALGLLSSNPRSPLLLSVTLCLVVGTALAYAMAMHPLRAHLFAQLRADKDLQQLGKFIGEHTDYSDVVFSPDVEVKPKPPQVIYYSMKLVHPAHSLDDIARKLRQAPDGYTVNLLLHDPATAPVSHDLPPMVKAFVDRAALVASANAYRLYRMPRTEFGTLHHSITP